MTYVVTCSLMNLTLMMPLSAAGDNVANWR